MVACFSVFAIPVFIKNLTIPGVVGSPKSLRDLIWKLLLSKYSLSVSNSTPLHPHQPGPTGGGTRVGRKSKSLSEYPARRQQVPPLLLPRPPIRTRRTEHPSPRNRHVPILAPRSSARPPFGAFRITPNRNNQPHHPDRLSEFDEIKP